MTPTARTADAPPAPAPPTGVDHLTVACTDLRLAERFYVDVLGARVLRRLDEATLESLGWSRSTIREKHAAHLQLGFGSGPRLEVFDYPEGLAARRGLAHPHIGLHVEPSAFPSWTPHLEHHRIPVAGPVRLGRPGQASLYLNDPFGNHLELVTLGVDTTEMMVGLPDRDALDYEWHPEPATTP